jgi:uncharacterized membrane protein (UPF0127 family)
MAKLVTWIAIIIGVSTVLYISYVIHMRSVQPQPHIQTQTTKAAAQTQGGQPMLPTTQIQIGDTYITAERATTAQEEAQGLSGRTGLADGTGMLFEFNPPKSAGFWMKDMLFSLDIVYIRADGTVVTIYPDLSPATYPQAFYPDEPVKWVLEVPAGFAAAHSIAIGQKVVVQ